MEQAMPNLRQVTPFIFTHDLEASCAFYEGVSLKPGLVMSEERYAYCTDGRVAVRLLELGKDHEIAEQMVYFDVENVDQFYRDLQPFLNTLPEGRVRAPFDQSYGQRELHVKDPDNCLLMFGQEIAEP
jgi:catechol 2,3-dioxygenase-like lactoylglutathione lyase family enzyme